MKIKKHELTKFVEDNILSNLDREYKVSYNPFDVYKKDNTEVEYLIAFNNTDNRMVFTIIYSHDEDDINLNRLIIGSTIVGEQLSTYTFTDNYLIDIKKIIKRLLSLMFNKY